MPRPSLNEQLDRLAMLSPADLRTEWERLHGQPCPALVPALLRLGLAHQVQLRAAGKRVRTMVAAAATTTAAPRRSRPAARIAPGTQLVRSWQGRTVSVVAEEDGFLWSGQRYPSLSAIARAVTGAHWSGPRFFGLTATGGVRG